MLINSISKNYQNIYSVCNIEKNLDKENQSFGCNYTEQNNLTFAQSNAIKNSLLLNSVAFKGRIIAPSFEAKDIKIIQNLLSKCRYGKKDLIYGDISPIKLQKTGSDISIENFYTKDDNQDGKITGICEELTYKLGKRLEKIFGDKYLFFALDGNNKEFPDAHTYLGALQNTPKNQDFIKSQTDKTALANKLYKEALSTFIAEGNNNNSMQKLNEVNAKLERLKLNMEAIKGCLVIDPSFNRLEEYGCGETNLIGYNANCVRTLNQINALPANSRVIPPMQGIPLGYLKDLAPEICNNENKNSILAINNFGEIIPSVGSDFSIIETLNPNHPLARFINKLNQ